MNDHTDGRPVLPLANGTLIDIRTGQPITPTLSAERVSEVNERKTKEAPEYTAARGRDRSNQPIRSGIVDLPADPKAVNTVGIVWVYFILGLNDAEIAEATGLKISQIDMIKGAVLFSQLDDRLKANIVKLQNVDVQARIENTAADALDRLINIAQSDQTTASTKARVLSNLLDRAGFSAKQITEHRHSLEGGLVIRHINDGPIAKNIPTVDIDKSEYTNSK